MQTKIKFIQRINVKILAILIVLFLIAGAGLIVLNYYTLKNIYENSLNDKVLVCNSLTAELLDANDIAAYVKSLSEQSDEFKAEQIQFNLDREHLSQLIAQGASEEQQQAVLAKLVEFQNNVKDKYNLRRDSFYFNLKNLEKLQEMCGAKYLYVVAFTGVVDDKDVPLLTFIYDASDLKEFDSPDCDGLGTVAYFEDEALEVFKTKQQMNHAMYSTDDLYGRLYFAYAPIIDDKGNVVAIIGTDISIDDMQQLLGKSVLINATVLIILVIAAIGFLYFFVNSALIKPIKHLTYTAKQLADGDVYAEVDEKFAKSTNELGILAKSISDMGGVYRDMITSTESLFEAANAGRLDLRNDPARFKGGIGKVVEQINDTLDATTMYLNSVPECLFLINKRFEIVFANSMFKLRFGDVSESEIVRTILAGKDDADDAAVNDALKRVHGCQCPIRRWINGKYYSVMIREIDIVESSESSILIIAIDNTDLENEKINAQAASTAKSEFLSRVSHELRTPMNVILGMSSLGVKECSDSKATERFKNIDSASRYLLTIINDVLDMSRIESGKMEIRNSVFDLPQLLNECYTMFEGTAAEKKIEFTINGYDDAPKFVECDGERLKQVLINLLSNSFKFTDTGGKISISFENLSANGEKAELKFTVSDTGIGMSKEFLDKVFMPFEQESTFLQRKYKGTGLGLSISKNLINLMGGDITVNSKVGEGSQFHIRIPVIISNESETIALQAENSQDIDISGLRVLLVDDIEINRLIFVEMFSDSGIVITEKSDGTEAVDEFAASEPFTYDIIFMDIQMMQMDGYEATRQIRALERPDRNVPIIAMTANALKQDIDNAHQCGMNGHIAKPIDYFVCLEQMRKFKNRTNKG